MASFGTIIHQIKEPVVNHPDADRLSLIRILGYTAIANKLDDGTPRYKQGDYVAYIQEGSILPEWLIKKSGLWDAEKGCGISMLKGANHDRIAASKLRGVFSQGLLFGVPVENGKLYVEGETETSTEFVEGDDIADFLGITKYEPEIPIGMAGEVLVMPHALNYDFESIQNVPDLFEHGEEVVVTEKEHGTNCQFGYIPNMNNDECFGDAGDIFVASKGIGGRRLAFKDNEANDRNVYVKMLRHALSQGLEGKLQSVNDGMHLDEFRSLHVFGEIVGKGIQDLHYGFDKPVLHVFDIAIDGVYLIPDECARVAHLLGLTMVKELYRGPYDLGVLATYRDGKDAWSGQNIREGIVIRSNSSSTHCLHGRRIGKWVSPDYLLRKSKNATEFQ